MRSLPLYALVLVLFASLNACAQTKKTTSAGSADPVILEATQRRTRPGRPEIPPYTTYRFRIIWKSTSAPSAVFFRPEAKVWKETTVARHEKRPGLSPRDFMVVEKNIKISDVKYNDTLIITTHQHAHDEEPMPAAVKRLPVNSLYYRTFAAPDKWIYIPVTVKKLPDMILP